MKTISVPIKFLDSYYDGSKYPGSRKCTGLKNGANCQYFVYEFLKHFGLKMPGFRSSDLWDDVAYTTKVKALRPLDIMLFNKSRRSYGAHVGVYVGANKVLHLCREVGFPTIWDLKDFRRRINYKFLIGAKRVKRPRSRR